MLRVYSHKDRCRFNNLLYVPEYDYFYCTKCGMTMPFMDALRLRRHTPVDSGLGIYQGIGRDTFMKFYGVFITDVKDL